MFKSMKSSFLGTTFIIISTAFKKYVQKHICIIMIIINILNKFLLQQNYFVFISILVPVDQKCSKIIELFWHGLVSIVWEACSTNLHIAHLKYLNLLTHVTHGNFWIYCFLVLNSGMKSQNAMTIPLWSKSRLFYYNAKYLLSFVKFETVSSKNPISFSLKQC